MFCVSCDEIETPANVSKHFQKSITNAVRNLSQAVAAQWDTTLSSKWTQFWCTHLHTQTYLIWFKNIFTKCDKINDIKNWIEETTIEITKASLWWTLPHIKILLKKAYVNNWRIIDKLNRYNKSDCYRSKQWKREKKNIWYTKSIWWWIWLGHVGLLG